MCSTSLVLSSSDIKHSAPCKSVLEDNWQTNLRGYQGFMQDQIFVSHIFFGGHMDVNC